MINKSRKGFSLLESAYLLIIAGIISSSYMGVKYVQIERQKATLTQEKMSAVEEALKAHVFFEGRLPCPAKMLPATDNNFGKESNCKDNKENDIKELNDSRIGYLPVESLGLPMEYSYDGWGNFMKYAINKEFSDENTFKHTQVNSSISIEDSQNPTQDTGYILLSSGKNGFGAKKWPNNRETKNKCDQQSILKKISNASAMSKILNNCQLQNNKIHADADGKTAQFIKWETMNNLLQIKKNWDLNRENPITDVDHILDNQISDTDADNLNTGIYIIKENTISNKKLQEWNIFPLLDPYTLVHLYQNFGRDFQGRVMQDTFAENDIIFRKNHGYYVLDNNEWIYLNNSLIKNDEMLSSIDRLMDKNFIDIDGIYLLTQDVTKLVVNLNTIHQSCRHLKQGDMIKVFNKQCFLINNLEKSNEKIIYLKEKKEFLEYKTQPDGGKIWETRYLVKQTKP